MFKILVVDDDAGLRLSIKSAFSISSKFEVMEAFDGINAMEKIKNSGVKFDVVILDVDMPRLNGLETLKQIKEFDPGIIVLMLTAHATLNDAVNAVKDGAYNYLSKPVSSEELLALVEKAMIAHSMISNIAASSPVLVEAGRKIIGNTSQMQKVFNIIHKLAKVETPVLIRGASGTGKELVAKAIHFNSTRKDEKFVAINCSAIPENLFESELFGHEKGSFTGASERKIGKFQYAEGGTLFLDEVGDMPQLMQVKILRVLQEKLFTPVGSNREIQSNVRIIAATNRPLEEMIKVGTFREDLFYRLNVVPIFLPALCDRKEDIERLVNIFVKKFNEVHRKKITGVTADAMNILKKYSWPGNIRELENVIEHSFVLESNHVISIASLPESVLAAVGVNLIDLDSLIESEKTNEQANNSELNSSGSFAKAPVFVDSGIDINDEDSDLSEEDVEDSDALGMKVTFNGELDFNAQKEVFEKEFIIKALKTFKGRINQTALHANIPKKTLLRKIEKYGIVAKDYSE
ncbi:MAG: sigma-54 dependent transcriptional regulator [Bdellovibrionaceae bacterium]|nr:sigma-54 dependent transcriptional regulator [Pseudobdellovibrionaceae bacterium]NUM57094.1 sigma-54-dependent Fis family transcriptional regulator [Pseudobdellovibrionaceae bacterium]